MEALVKMGKKEMAKKAALKKNLNHFVFRTCLLRTPFFLDLHPHLAYLSTLLLGDIPYSRRRQKKKNPIYYYDLFIIMKVI